MEKDFCRVSRCKFIHETRERACWILLVAWILFSPIEVNAQEKTGDIQDITGKYHFLAAGDTLGLLEEEGKLKGYIDVHQGEEESDTVLSYTINLGWRKKDRVEFKTGKIHQKYYRFAGKVQRGSGPAEKDADYLRLVGGLEIVTVKGETGEETAQRMQVVFKSMGRADEGEE